MALTKIDDRGLKTPIDLLDNEKIRLGTGNDLELYHDGASRITHTGAGNLVISTTATDSDLYLRGKDKVVIQPADGEDGVICNANGSVNLYYDGVKKCETHADGLHIGDGGNLDMPHDSSKIVLGASDDLQIYHDGTNSHLHNATGELKIRGNDVRLMNAAGNEHMLIGTANGHVRLYYDNSLKFETTSLGAKVVGDLQMGNTAGVRFHHAGTTSIFETQTAGDDLIFKTTPSGGSTTERLRVDSTGKVGINRTTTLVGLLDVKGVDDDSIKFSASAYGGGHLRITGADTNIGGTAGPYNHTIRFKTKTQNNNAGNGAEKDALIFYHEGWSGLNLTSFPNSKVGIGTSNPANYLHLGASGADAVRSLQIDGTNGSSENQGFIIENDGANGRVNLKLGTGGGTPATKLTLLPAGGLTFNGDTAAANALDDYEEGSWSPVLNKVSVSGTITATYTRYASYVKVGKMLWISFYLQIDNSSWGTGTGQWYISGLPFSLESATAAGYQFIPVGYFGIDGAEINQTTEQARLQANNQGGNPATLTMYGSSSKTNWTTSHFWLSASGFLEVQ